MCVLGEGDPELSISVIYLPRIVSSRHTETTCRFVSACWPRVQRNSVQCFLFSHCKLKK